MKSLKDIFEEIHREGVGELSSLPVYDSIKQPEIATRDSHQETESHEPVEQVEPPVEDHPELEEANDITLPAFEPEQVVPHQSVEPPSDELAITAGDNRNDRVQDGVDQPAIEAPVQESLDETDAPQVEPPMEPQAFHESPEYPSAGDVEADSPQAVQVQELSQEEVLVPPPYDSIELSTSEIGTPDRLDPTDSVEEGSPSLSEQFVMRNLEDIDSAEFLLPHEDAPDSSPMWGTNSENEKLNEFKDVKSYLERQYDPIEKPSPTLDTQIEEQVDLFNQRNAH